ncbi:MAG: hypothetical protein K2W96_03985 [Gemmataceae bacterium]|nr:hypothetical protein [Gemmataceae bacterium]
MLAVAAGFAFAEGGGDAPKPAAGLARLADEMQQTPPAKLLPLLSERLAKGTTLRDLVAAGAIANARAFGGQDYNGYHTFMALCPSFVMASAMPEKERALPILKVLYRNSQLIHGGRCEKEDRLAPVEAKLDGTKPAAEQVRAATRAMQLPKAEAAFAALEGAPQEQYDALQPMVQDDLNVHRTVLAWRAWETLGFTGLGHARAMLRQTVRFCADPRHSRRGDHPIRAALPKLLSDHKLEGRKPGAKKADDAWVEKLAGVVYKEPSAKAAEAVAAALAEGFSAESVGEALSLASTLLVLGDPGRPKEWASEAKPVGSVHGDSVGVHASDASNAWRHIAQASAPHACASLVAAAWHTAGQAGRQMAELWPAKSDLGKVEEKDGDKLLSALGEAVKGKDQKRACAVSARYLGLGHDAKALLAALLSYSVSEDGALHAEKYWHTAAEEYGRGRKAFRDKHLVALARVCASAWGKPADGVAEARKLLKA